PSGVSWVLCAGWIRPGAARECRTLDRARTGFHPGPRTSTSRKHLLALLVVPVLGRRAAEQLGEVLAHLGEARVPALALAQDLGRLLALALRREELCQALAGGVEVGIALQR